MTAESIFKLRRTSNLALGGALSIMLMLGVATLSARPSWQSLPPDMAIVRLSFTHSGVQNCRDRTPEELAALPPNMRSKKLCDRRRAPVKVEMDVNGRTVLATELKPSGLAGSGPSRIYHRYMLPAGTYRLDLRLSEDPAASGFKYRSNFEVQLAPTKSVAIDFNPATGSFFLH